MLGLDEVEMADLLSVHFYLVSFQAVRKLNEAKKLESSAHYNADFGKD